MKMQEKLEQRLAELEANYQQGVAMVSERETLRTRLVELDNQAPALAVTMHRISGAIQAIKELLEVKNATD